MVLQGGREVKGQCAQTGRGCGNFGVSHNAHDNRMCSVSSHVVCGSNRIQTKLSLLIKSIWISCQCTGFIPDKHLLYLVQLIAVVAVP